ncbi:MAG: GDP-L-fucose synthetase [Verrucomicrobiales bacterium]|nr:GDP-L-fucose synthetase [Verrucomicrobiales bacterium]
MRLLSGNSKIFVPGHRGLVGSAIVRQLEAAGCGNLLLKTRAELDLLDPTAVDVFFATHRPEFVISAAAKVGGIKANATEPATFLRENLGIQNNLFQSAWRYEVRKFLFLGSSCIYPKFAPQPLKEEYLLSGPLEPTNEPYAIAKIAGIKMAQAFRRQYACDFISAMPSNMYGLQDNFDLQTSHVLPALIRKFHEAKCSGDGEVICWGTGTPRRELLFADDLASGCLFLMENYSDEQFVNVGYGSDVAIRELAEMVAAIVGFQGMISWDDSKPDGTPRKLLDSSRILAMGWKPAVKLEDGIRMTYDAFRKRSLAH